MGVETLNLNNGLRVDIPQNRLNIKVVLHNGNVLASLHRKENDLVIIFEKICLYSANTHTRWDVMQLIFRICDCGF